MSAVSTFCAVPTFMGNTKTEPSDEEIERGKAFAAWLRDAARRRGVHQKGLAELIEMSPTGIGVLYNNGWDKQAERIRRPSEATIAKIASVTGANEDKGRVAAGYAPRPRRADEIPGIVPGAVPVRFSTGDVVFLSPDDPEPENTCAALESFLRTWRQQREQSQQAN